MEFIIIKYINKYYMDNYKKFIKTALQNNDMKSLRKYDTLTKRLAKKNKNFSRFLLTKNKSIYNQYGGREIYIKQNDTLNARLIDKTIKR